MIRRPVVAGTFYESDPARLRKTVLGFLAGGPRVKALGVIAPHAGYIYSGAVAGKVYSGIEPAETYIVLSPNHTGLGPDVSIMCRGGWETPLGITKIDEDLASSILQGSDLLREDQTAHLQEHSVEVQLPFLQALGAATFVPVTVMSLGYHQCEEIGQALAAQVRACKKSVLVVASSDMSHYETHDAATRKDRMALDKIEALDPEGLFDVVRSRRITMCGFIPSAIMLVAAKALGARRATVVQYATSGDVSGDFERVVGYAGVIVE